MKKLLYSLCFILFTSTLSIRAWGNDIDSQIKNWLCGKNEMQIVKIEHWENVFCSQRLDTFSKNINTIFRCTYNDRFELFLIIKAKIDTLNGPNHFRISDGRIKLYMYDHLTHMGLSFINSYDVLVDSSISVNKLTSGGDTYNIIIYDKYFKSVGKLSIITRDFSRKNKLFFHPLEMLNGASSVNVPYSIFENISLREDCKSINLFFTQLKEFESIYGHLWQNR